MLMMIMMPLLCCVNSSGLWWSESRSDEFIHPGDTFHLLVAKVWDADDIRYREEIVNFPIDQ